MQTEAQSTEKTTTLPAEILLQLAEKYGTPLYVYDAEKIISQYKSMYNAFRKSKVKIKYACKALSNISVLKLLRQAGAGLDTVSPGEIRLGLLAGFSPDDIIFTPNCVSVKEYEEAAQLGVKINIDNIPMLEQFAEHYGNRIPVCIRINPHIYAGGNHQISTGHIDSKFGISIHQLRHVERVIQKTGIVVNGLHMHTGSDIIDADVFMRGAEIMFDCAANFKDLEFIDFGSGFKVAYHQDDEATDINQVGEQLTARFNDFCQEYGRELELYFEPGKYIVSESGVLLASVNLIKQTTATVFLGLDTGFNHLIRPMFYDAYHKIINISNPKGLKRIYTVVGNICETDTFAYDRRINEARTGDVIAFLNAGAYGFEMSSNFNSRYRPAEVLVYDGKDYLIRKRDEFEDLVRNQILVEFDLK
jgi:diaminopimelate decarboxylase